MNLTDLFGTSTTEKSDPEYQKVTRIGRADENQQEVDADALVQFVDINQKTDIIQTKDELRNGNIVLANLSKLSPNLSKERALSDLRNAAEDAGGDIVRHQDSELTVITPPGVKVSRQVL